MGNSVNYESENRKRLTIVSVASVIFILALSAIFFCVVSLLLLAEINNSVENVEEFGYSVYYHDGEEVSQEQFAGLLDSLINNEYYSSGNFDYDNYSYYDAETNTHFNTYDEYYDYRYDQVVTFVETATVDYDLSEGFYIVDTFPSFSFDENQYNKYMSALWVFAILSMILAPVSLLLVIIFCGQKDSTGEIKLIWIDKIFVEIQVGIVAAVSLIIIPVYYLLNSWLSTSPWGREHILQMFPQSTWNSIGPWLTYLGLDYYDMRFIDALFHPTWVMLVLSIVIILLISTIYLLSIASFTKKIKTHSFWKKTIIGSLIFWLNNNIGISKKIYIKMIALALLVTAGFTFASAMFTSDFNFVLMASIFLVLILLVVPRQIKKYNKIMQGLTNIQNGDFSHKISGVGNGALGDLANVINSINDVHSEAINNELRSQRLKTELISNVSHDLRTPLTSMISYVDLLNSEGLDSENAQDYLDIISEKTDRLQKLTDDLFEAAKASSGDIPVNIEQIDLDAMVNQALAELDENIASNDIEVIYTNNSESSMILADGNLLWRVIENLLVNVGKYAMTGSRAYVDIVDKFEKIALEIKNISSYSLNITADELMERFQRGDDSRNTDGSGLGLSIVNDLTMLMNGKFDLYVDGDLFKATVEFFKA